MKAKHLLETTSHPPEVLRKVFQAFDLAWEEWQREHPTPEAHAVHERERLARLLLSQVREGTNDVTDLKNAALAALRRGAP